MGRGVWGEEYAFAVSGAKLVLNPLTRLNRDEHSMRSFETPAFNRAMVTDRTPEHQHLFQEDQEAVFYSEAEECLEKIRALLKDEGSRQTIAHQGLRRVRTGEHSAMHRAAQQLAAALLVRRGQKVFGELSQGSIRDALASQGLAYPGPEVAYPEYWQ
jgi:hypothetical protein